MDLDSRKNTNNNESIIFNILISEMLAETDFVDLVDEDAGPTSPVQDFLSDSDEESGDEDQGQFFFYFDICETVLIGKYI